jgi:hypothetical protein
MFDFLNKLLGHKTTGEIRESKEKSRRLKRDAELRKSAANAKPAPQKQRVFRPDADPEYYSQRGLAKNEAESQRMVNEYREKGYPGVKPLFPKN